MIKKYKKLFVMFFSAVFVLMVLPLTGLALTAKHGDNVIISETVDGNFFGAGNVVMITGTINGDVFVAGNSVSISGVVNGDVFAAGSNVDIAGIVTGNLRVVGSVVSIRGRVDRNILSAASNFTLSDGAYVGGHMTFAGASMILNAPVGGQIDAAVPSMVINNSVGGNINLRMDGDKTKLTLLSKAIIRGNLKYNASSEAEIDDGAQVLGRIDFAPQESSKKIEKENGKKILGAFAGFFAFMKVVGFVSLFILGLLLIYFVPKIVDRVGDSMKKKFWPNLGVGSVAIIVSPILGIFLFATILGIPLALLFLALYFTTLFLAKAFVAIVLGRLICDRFSWKLHKILSLLLGLVVFVVVSSVPFFGWLAACVLVVWTFGAFLRVDSEILKEWR